MMATSANLESQLVVTTCLGNWPTIVSACYELFVTTHLLMIRLISSKQQHPHGAAHGSTARVT